jgi:uncharacterized protein (TIGR02588 family)
MARDEHGEGGSAGKRMPPAEWIAALLGGTVALGTIGFIAYHGLTDADTPPRIEVEARDVREAGDLYLVRFRAINRGGETGAQVMIEGRLAEGGQDIETAETVLDYVPAHSTREGGLFFRNDPRRHSLDLSAGGYAEP